MNRAKEHSVRRSNFAIRRNIFRQPIQIFRINSFPLLLQFVKNLYLMNCPIDTLLTGTISYPVVIKVVVNPSSKNVT